MYPWINLYRVRYYQGFSLVITDLWVGDEVRSGGFPDLVGRVRSGQESAGQGSAGVPKISWDGSGRRFSIIMGRVGLGQPEPIRPVRTDPTRKHPSVLYQPPSVSVHRYAYRMLCAGGTALCITVWSFGHISCPSSPVCVELRPRCISSRSTVSIVSPLKL